MGSPSWDDPFVGYGRRTCFNIRSDPFDAGRMHLTASFQAEHFHRRAGGAIAAEWLATFRSSPPHEAPYLAASTDEAGSRPAEELTWSHCWGLALRHGASDE